MKKAKKARKPVKRMSARETEALFAQMRANIERTERENERLRAAQR